MEGITVFRFFIIFVLLARVIWGIRAIRRGIVGAECIVFKEYGSKAMIEVNRHDWYAVADDGNPLRIGEAVVVQRVKGLQLAVVSRIGSRAPAQPT